PGAVPGQTGFVAVTHRPRLLAALAALEAAGRGVDRVVPASMPTGIGADPTLELAGLPLRGHFHHRAVSGVRQDTTEAGEASPWLSLARGDGVSVLRLSGALARALVFGSPPSAEPPAGRWTATPAAAAAAEAWLSASVELLTDAERALEAAATDANLRQFDLAPRHRGTRALRELGKQFGSASWRPVRIGLAVLLLAQVVGLNLHAWQLRRAVEQRKQAMIVLLQTTHPNVRAVLDAPLQMQRETERLRAAAGRPGGADLESLLGAAAAAWPENTGPVQTLRFESGALTLAAPGWTEPQLTQFRNRLRGSGFAVESAEDRLTVTRAGAAAPSPRGAA
ncbi:MAG: type II secretion system protein GspL, partial [Pseudomonadota bacterium]|nr:type II secretion system protein GspL [Pseudomonadota bacterium]